ncbi:hypothetical protein Slin14017_G046770 [Septoria linicola]|nr:hypothetical protein Slin14017_G046770 [Septoria linicola]
MAVDTTAAWYQPLRTEKSNASSIKTTTCGDPDVAQALEIDSEVQTMDKKAAKRERQARKKAHREAAKQESNVQEEPGEGGTSNASSATVAKNTTSTKEQTTKKQKTINSTSKKEKAVKAEPVKESTSGPDTNIGGKPKKKSRRLKKDTTIRQHFEDCKAAQQVSGAKGTTASTAAPSSPLGSSLSHLPSSPAQPALKKSKRNVIVEHQASDGPPEQQPLSKKETVKVGGAKGTIAASTAPSSPLSSALTDMPTSPTQRILKKTKRKAVAEDSASDEPPEQQPIIKKKRSKHGKTAKSAIREAEPKSSSSWAGFSD